MRKERTVKAAFLTGIRKVEIRQAPDPVRQSDDDVLLRIQAVGVCGSDMHYYRTGRIGNLVVEYPFIVGHECAGTVVEAGPKSPLAAGQCVAIDPLVVCGQCDQCLAGRFHTCRKQRFLGCPGQLAGSLAEYLVMPSRCCYPIPDSLTFDQAVMSEPLSIGLWTVKLARRTAGKKIAVLGCGPIGMCTLLALRAAGPCTVYATDLREERLRATRRLGADWTGNPTRQDVVAEILRLQGDGLDLVFEAAGEQETLDQAVQLLRPGGTLAMVGIPEGDRVSFDVSNMRRKELTIQNVRRQNECVAPAIELIADGRVNVDAMITHRFSLDETAGAFEIAADYRDGIVKGMIHL